MVKFLKSLPHPQDLRLCDIVNCSVLLLPGFLDLKGRREITINKEPSSLFATLVLIPEAAKEQWLFPFDHEEFTTSTNFTKKTWHQ